ncbi:hypothetical protein RB595_003140 [Gaeumannomyces hyphopodioides]
MFFSYTAVVLAALAGVNAHSTFLGLTGVAGSPKSVAFKVIPDLARNCTTPSPCQQDATIIRQGEISAKIVDVCGRTEQAGSIDIKTETEKAVKSGALAKVTGGTTVTMDVHQVNADGAGPYVCDVDQTGNGQFVEMTVTDNIPGANGLSTAKTEQFQMKATMPNDLKCTGGSTGDICIVRCRNNAQAGPFGGCIPVQQQAAGAGAGATTGGATGGANRNNRNNAANRNNNNAASRNNNAANRQ